MLRKWRNLAKNQAKLRTIDRFSWWSGKYQRNLFQEFDKIFSHQLALSKWPCWKILLYMCLHPFLTFTGLDIPLIWVGIYSWHTISLGHKYIVLFYQFFFISNFWKAVVLCDLKISRSWCEFDRVKYFHFPSWFFLVCGNLLGIGSFSLSLSVFTL